MRMIKWGVTAGHTIFRIDIGIADISTVTEITGAIAPVDAGVYCNRIKIGGVDKNFCPLLFNRFTDPVDDK